MSTRPAETDGLWAGTGEVDITPELGCELAGGFEPRLADHIESRLYAKALALRSGPSGGSATGSLLLISCDTLMMSAAVVVDRAKQQITERTGVSGTRVVISATHAHSTPNTVPELGVPDVDAHYVDRMVNAIATAAEIAVTTAIPARISYGQTPVAGVCFHRRYRLNDGTVQMNPGRNRTDVIGPAGPVDPLVTALLVEDRAGTPLAVWANLAVHYVGAQTPTSISADYFGAVTRRLQSMLGHPVHVQVTNGCSGNINNADLDAQVPATGPARTDLVATAVAGAAAAATLMAPRHIDVDVWARLRQVELQRAEVTEEDRRIAREFRSGQRDDVPFSYVTGAPIAGGAKRYFADMLEILDARPPTATAPVMVLGVGELALVSLPGEVFVEHGLRIRERSPYHYTAVIGLANDHIGYLPTEQAIADGGYETWRNGVSWTAPGSGERLVEEACSLLAAGPPLGSPRPDLHE